MFSNCLKKLTQRSIAAVSLIIRINLDSKGRNQNRADKLSRIGRIFVGIFQSVAGASVYPHNKRCEIYTNEWA